MGYCGVVAGNIATHDSPFASSFFPALISTFPVHSSHPLPTFEVAWFGYGTLTREVTRGTLLVDNPLKPAAVLSKQASRHVRCVL